MKARLKLTMTLLAGFALGVVVAHSVHAQVAPPVLQQAPPPGNKPLIPEETTPTFETQQKRQKLYEQGMKQPSGVPHDTESFHAPVENCSTGRCKFVKWDYGMAGACDLHSPNLDIFPDGKVRWTTLAKSYEDDDAYCTIVIFLDANGTRLWTFGRMCSQTLSTYYESWNRDNLAIPRHIYNDIARVYRKDHC